MQIDFDSIPQEEIPNFRGGDGVFRIRSGVFEGTKVMRSVLPSGSSIGVHKHDGNCEVMFFVSGTGKAICDGKEERIAPGVCHFCPEGSSHGIINDGPEDLVMYAAITELK